MDIFLCDHPLLDHTDLHNEAGERACLVDVMAQAIYATKYLGG